MTTRRESGILLGALLLGSGVASAEEKKIPESQVPRPVIAAVGKKYPDAKLKGFEKETDQGKIRYEVSIVSTSKGSVDIDLSPEGKILAEETKIKTAALPKTVKNGVSTSKYQAWKVTGWEKVIENERDDQPFYEGVFLSKDKKVEVVFDAQGKITKEEDQAASEKDDD